MLAPAGAVAPAGAGAAPAAEAEEAPAAEKTHFTVKLDKFDAASKIKLIKEVRAITGLGLKEAKELVEGAPKDIKVWPSPAHWHRQPSRHATPRYATPSHHTPRCATPCPPPDPLHRARSYPPHSAPHSAMVPFAGGRKEGGGRGAQGQAGGGGRCHRRRVDVAGRGGRGSRVPRASRGGEWGG